MQGSASRRPFRRSRPLVAAVALAVTGAACSGTSRQGVAEQHWDVLGTVESATLSPEFGPADAEFSRGGHLTPGPSTLMLAGGRVLTVPAGTPGGNLCIELLSDADLEALTGDPSTPGQPNTTVDRSAGLSPHCVIVATVGDADTVQRFEILESTNDGLAIVGDLVDRDEAGYLSSSGYRFDAAEDVVIACEIGEPPTVDDFLDADTIGEAYVDPDSGEIVEIHCLYDA